MCYWVILYVHTSTDFESSRIDDEFQDKSLNTIRKICMQTATIKVRGMTCDNCGNSVSLALNNVKGVQVVDVGLLESLVVVKYDEKFTDLAHLKATIQTTGYSVD